MREVKNIEDARIVIKEIAQWKDRISSKSQDLKGLKIQNAGDATEPGDYVTLRQLPSLVQAPTVAPQHYSIPFSAPGLIVTGQMSPPYIVGQDRVGIPTSISVAVPSAAQAPTGVPLIVNLNINGINMLVNNLTLPVGQEGPVSSSAFVNPLPKLAIGNKIVPVIIQGGGAQFVTIQLYITRILS